MSSSAAKIYNRALSNSATIRPVERSDSSEMFSMESLSVCQNELPGPYVKSIMSMAGKPFSRNGTSYTEGSDPF